MSRPDDLLGAVLKRVSRSFYLSLAILPRELREPIGLAYLLARAADTVADTRLIARAERLAHLDTLRRAYAGEDVDVSPVARACAPRQSDAPERTLVERVHEGIARLGALGSEDRDPARAVLATLTSGMVFDLTRFPGDDGEHVTALDTVEELDRYTYLVAGCVGEFWTRLHVAHRRRLARWNVVEMSRSGVRFGKALQLTNVLRDVPQDLAHGRCYLPAQELARVGLADPKDLFTADGALRARPLLGRLMDAALAHYAVAWDYTLAIPRAEVRMRLACAWPLLIGLGTLAEVAAHPSPLAARAPIKMSRAAVRTLLARSIVAVWSDRALRREAARLTARAANSLALLVGAHAP
jgi:farnesyl-diphosphate farnesyltransferase